MEIERKWLMTQKPQGLPVLQTAVLRQGYLCTHPTVRIRSKRCGGKDTFRLCIKGKGTLVREEIELDLPREKFEALSCLLEKPLIRKDYTVFALPGGLRLEYSDVDAGLPGAFSYAEVEFTSVEAARAFVPPDFLDREVTEEPGWTMAAYWEKRDPVQK
ncbi:MAG: CYTH domain-containing protein [Oscillospiraceae bacterium]|jgi:adenylate cyclase|nr:CYTH domain-containing protein [Oscillospiraceae bacterium]MDD3260915.1 CYTH domain-containing protein [Oscillospiraceae bacterium]